jgi:hypothetical protein
MRTLTLLVAAIGAAAATVAVADTVGAPERRPGLWESTLTVAGQPSRTLRMCTDAALEQRHAMFSAKATPDCPTVESHAVTGGVAFRSICTRAGVTISTEGTVTGDFNDHYRFQSVVRTSPATGPGGGERKTSIESRWLGACPPGSRPGDVTLPDGRVVNREQQP